MFFDVGPKMALNDPPPLSTTQVALRYAHHDLIKYLYFMI